MKDFKKLLVWQKALDIVELVFKFSESLPSEEKFGIRSQITRASVSMPSIIAEGSSRDSTKEYAHYLSIALGSSFELETQLMICNRAKIGNDELNNRIIEENQTFQKMLSNFRTKILTNN